MRGRRASALAISTICRRDSDRSLTSARGWMSSAPARASASSAMRRCALRSIRPKRCGGLLIAMLSATDRSGINDSSWKMQTMPAAFAAAGDCERDRLAVQQHAALVGHHDAGHALDERRLACTVLAEHGVDAAGLDHEVGRLQRMHAAVALADALQVEQAHPSSRRHDRAYLLASDCPMISCAVKLMSQVGNALPTKKLSDCAA